MDDFVGASSGPFFYPQCLVRVWHGVSPLHTGEWGEEGRLLAEGMHILRHNGIN